MPKRDSKDELHVRCVLDVPLREVSGICLLRGRRHRLVLVAVGDRAAKAACLSLPPKDFDSLRWRTIELTGFAGSQLPEEDPQIEAICADGAGRVLLLQESPPRAELLDPGLLKSVASIDLEVEGPGKLAKSWSRPKGSRGEGAAFLPRGNLLVAKEKDPAAFIEFGPEGSTPGGLARGGGLRDGTKWLHAKGSQRFVALASWFPDKPLAKACADFSDMEIGPDGRLYVLSDQSASIARIDDLQVDDSTARLAASWKLRSLKGKPEGLAFTPDGRAIVAVDKRKQRRNLYLLEPTIASPR